jgi:CBS domain-containing protein
VTVEPDDSIETAARLMREHEVAHLVVLEPSVGFVVGVVSSLDVAGALAAV